MPRPLTPVSLSSSMSEKQSARPLTSSSLDSGISFIPDGARGVGVDRLNVPATGTFSHWTRGSRTNACLPVLVGVLHYRVSFVCTVQETGWHSQWLPVPIGGVLAVRVHCALLLDQITPKEPPNTPSKRP